MLRPNNYEEFLKYKESGLLNHVSCIQCKNLMSENNVRTQMGWRETPITGLCEVCFDKIFEGDDDGS